MYFKKELIQIGFDLPKFKIDSNPDAVCTEQSFNISTIPNKIYKCPYCGCRFIHLSSFINSCHERHLRDPLKIQRRRRRVIRKNVSKSVKKLPKDYLYYCKICGYVTCSYLCYRDHQLGHIDPAIKECSICESVFSSGRNADRHKKKLHPELYEKEIQERIQRNKERGPTRLVYYTIHKSKVKDGVENGSKSVRIVLERIRLPGFLCNDWICLPKRENEYPWISEENRKSVKFNWKSEEIQKVKKEKDEESDDDFTWPLSDGNSFGETSSCQVKMSTNEAENEIESFMIKHQYPETDSILSIKHDGDDFEWPMSSYDPSNNESPEPIETKPKINQKRYFISPEEIPDIPKYNGAKYLFGVYKARNHWRNKLFKIRRRLGLVDVREKNDLTVPTNLVTCLICGAKRFSTSIRGHVAIHYFEEDENVCRFCSYSQCDRIKMKQHYVMNHKINFRKYLMGLEKQRLEKDEPASGNYVTCQICHTNLKNDDHLTYHTQMLHNVKARGNALIQNSTNECTICGVKYKNRINFQIHVRRYHRDILCEGKEEVICHHCGKRFASKGYIRLHFIHFHRERDPTEPIICEMCGEVLVSRKIVRRHKCGVKKIRAKKRVNPKTKEACLAHRAITDFSSAFCHLCNKKFISAYNFQLHVRNYTEDVYVCEFKGCGSRFTSKVTYKRHLRLNHDG